MCNVDKVNPFKTYEPNIEVGKIRFNNTSNEDDCEGGCLRF